MKRLMLIAFIFCTLALSQAFASGVEIASAKIVAELKKDYAKRTAQDIVLADFVTVNVPQSTFGDYLTESLTDAFKADRSVKILDQQKVNRVLKNRNFFFNADYEYKVIDEISQEIFKSAHETPTAYCFGQIREFGDDIKISVKMIDAQTGDVIAASNVTFPSDETTDRLLGKPVRQRKPLKPDTVVVVKERIIEKPIEVQPGKTIDTHEAKPIDKHEAKTIEVYTAKPIDVYTAKPIEVYKAKTIDAGAAVQEFKTQGFTVTLKKCYFSGNALIFDFTVTNENDMTKEFMFERCVAIDPNGNTVKADHLNLAARSGESHVRADLVSNAPVKASMGFSGLSPKLAAIKALQITALGREYVLRDIAIEKE